MEMLESGRERLEIYRGMRVARRLCSRRALYLARRNSLRAMVLWMKAMATFPIVWLFGMAWSERCSKLMIQLLLLYIVCFCVDLHSRHPDLLRYDSWYDDWPALLLNTDLILEISTLRLFLNQESADVSCCYYKTRLE